MYLEHIQNNSLYIEIQILLIIIFYFNYCSGLIETLVVSKQVSNNIDNTCLEIEF